MSSSPTLSSSSGHPPSPPRRRSPTPALPPAPPPLCMHDHRSSLSRTAAPSPCAAAPPSPLASAAVPFPRANRHPSPHASRHPSPRAAPPCDACGGRREEAGLVGRWRRQAGGGGGERACASEREDQGRAGWGGEEGGGEHAGARVTEGERGDEEATVSIWVGTVRPFWRNHSNSHLREIFPTGVTPTHVYFQPNKGPTRSNLSQPTIQTHSNLGGVLTKK